MKYDIRGYDAWGHPVMEAMEYIPLSRGQRFKLFLARFIPQNLAYRLGLTKFRKISGILVKK